MLWCRQPRAVKSGTRRISSFSIEKSLLDAPNHALNNLPKSPQLFSATLNFTPELSTAPSPGLTRGQPPLMKGKGGAIEQGSLLGHQICFKVAPVEAGATCDKKKVGEDEGSERCDSSDGHWIRREIKMLLFSVTGAMKHARCFPREARLRCFERGKMR